MGEVYCDVLPGQIATVKDNWSGLNLCPEVASILSKHNPAQSYFSQGTDAPRVHEFEIAPSYNLTVGVGIQIQRNANGYHEILRVVEGGPAQAAGLQAGDVLLFVDGNNVETLGEELHDRICGAAGSSVNLIVKRREQQLPAFRIRREAVSSSVAVSQSYEQKAFYVSEEDKREAILEAEVRVRTIREAIYGSDVYVSDVYEKPRDAAPQQPLAYDQTWEQVEIQGTEV